MPCPERQQHRCARLVAARRALDPLGWFVLLQWRRAAGVAAVHPGVSARRARRGHSHAASAHAGISFPKGAAGWKTFFAIGLLNNVIPFSLIVIGQTFIPSGLASILNAITPLFTVIVMAMAREEALQMRRVARVVLGFVGVVILRGWGIETRPGQELGILLCLGGASSYGLAALAARRLLRDAVPLGTATFQLMASTVMMAIVAGTMEQPWRLPIPGPTTWLAVLGLAGLSTALAYIVFFQILRRSGRPTSCW